MTSLCGRSRYWVSQCKHVSERPRPALIPYSVQDPFEEYKKRLNAKLKKADLSEEALAERAARKAKREQDRTTWLGTKLGAKGDRQAADDSVGVGKYLQPAKRAAPEVAGSSETESKKAKKLGTFGDFSGW